MMTILYILIAIIAIIILLALIAPKKFDVSRSIIINRPLAEVFNYIKYVKNQNYWGPWNQRDPNMKQTFTGEDGTVGFISAWESNHKQVGSGEQEITQVIENVKMESELRFLKPFKAVNYGYIDVFEEKDNKTKVVWGFHGNNKFPFSIMMLFMSMDKMIGKDFEEGLASLKAILEK
ncbi:MAG: SRPBCC family protein [Flavobacteriaceae bacterium]